MRTRGSFAALQLFSSLAIVENCKTHVCCGGFCEDVALRRSCCTSPCQEPCWSSSCSPRGCCSFCRSPGWSCTGLPWKSHLSEEKQVQLWSCTLCTTGQLPDNLHHVVHSHHLLHVHHQHHDHLLGVDPTGCLAEQGAVVALLQEVLL